jgi:hypothetical protein
MPGRRGQHDLVSWLSRSLCSFDQELRVTDDVHEKDDSDLKVEIVVGFRRHDLSSSSAKAGCPSLLTGPSRVVKLCPQATQATQVRSKSFSSRW